MCALSIKVPIRKKSGNLFNEIWTSNVEYLSSRNMVTANMHIYRCWSRKILNLLGRKYKHEKGSGRWIFSDI